MTTYLFTPTSQGPFTFYPTLDGNPYTCIVTANLFANTPVTGRYYLNVYGQNNTLIVCLPVIESPVAIPLTSLTWDSNTGLAYGTSSAPLVSGANAMPGGVGATLEFTLSAVTPSGYSGTFPCFIRSPTSFSFPLATDPGGPATALGNVGPQINMIGGYFTTSTLIFVNNAFVVSP